MDHDLHEVRADLRLVQIDLMSLVRTGLLVALSIAASIVASTIVLYLLLLGMGVFDAVDQVLGDLTGGAGTLTETFTLPFVTLISLVVAAFEVIVTTALVTLFGLIYNLTVPFTRGLRVTLAEDRRRLLVQQEQQRKTEQPGQSGRP